MQLVLLGRWAGQRSQIGQRVLAPHGHVGRWQLQPPHAASGAVAAAAAVRRSPTFLRSCGAAGEAPQRGADAGKGHAMSFPLHL